MRSGSAAFAINTALIKDELARAEEPSARATEWDVPTPRTDEPHDRLA
jgi:hypothetical protein